jgi:hypothetical protein
MSQQKQIYEWNIAIGVGDIASRAYRVCDVYNINIPVQKYANISLMCHDVTPLV